jgi:hypothetical protein
MGHGTAVAFGRIEACYGKDSLHQAGRRVFTIGPNRLAILRVLVNLLQHNRQRYGLLVFLIEN